jgi:hypothetical protein
LKDNCYGCLRAQQYNFKSIAEFPYPAQRQILVPQMERVALVQSQTIEQPNQPIENVYFPEERSGPN